MVALSDEQVENWRKILVTMIGPYAMLMSRDQICAIRDKMQSHIDKIEKGVSYVNTTRAK